jgi:cytochrome c-type biogenesis protein CcmH
LGRTQRSLGEYNSAVKAFERALQVAGENSSAELLSDYGETLVFESFGTVSPRAVETFRKALSKNPQDIKSRFYIAASRSQLGDYRGAIALWRGLTADAPPDAPWLESVREQISNAAMKGGIMPMSVQPERAVSSTSGLTGAIAGDVRPDKETVAAVQEMAPSDQQAFIGSMVQRLADRMDKNPDDVDGWLRLGRAYKVLEDPRKANDAFKRAKISLEKALSKAPVGSSTRSNLERKLRDIEALIKG